MTDFNISCFLDTSLVCDLSFESGEGNVSMIHLKPKGPCLCILQNCNGDRSAEQHELIKSLLPLTTSRLSRVLTFSSLLIKRLANSHLGIEKKNTTLAWRLTLQICAHFTTGLPSHRSAGTHGGAGRNLTIKDNKFCGPVFKFWHEKKCKINWGSARQAI